MRDEIKPRIFNKKMLAILFTICYIGSRGTSPNKTNQKGVSRMIKDEDRNNKNEMCHYGMEKTEGQFDSNKLSDLIGGLSR